MSSYINDRRHFDSIAAGIKKLLRCRDFCPSHELATHLRSETPHSQDADTAGRVDELIGVLVAIQVESVCRRYPSGGDVETYIAEQRHLMDVPIRKREAISPVALYKAIACSLYQIERRLIDDARVMTPGEEECLAFFGRLRSEVAEYIVRQLHEYRVAKWDITKESRETLPYPVYTGEAAREKSAWLLHSVGRGLSQYQLELPEDRCCGYFQEGDHWVAFDNSGHNCWVEEFGSDRRCREFIYGR